MKGCHASPFAGKRRFLEILPPPAKAFGGFPLGSRHGRSRPNRPFILTG
jgi:hypothetical protein